MMGAIQRMGERTHNTQRRLSMTTLLASRKIKDGSAFFFTWCLLFPLVFCPVFMQNFPLNLPSPPMSIMRPLTVKIFLLSLSKFSRHPPFVHCAWCDQCIYRRRRQPFGCPLRAAMGCLLQQRACIVQLTSAGFGIFGRRYKYVLVP